MTLCDAPKYSSESESSDDPPPIRVSLLKRYEDFGTDDKRIQYINARIEQLHDEIMRMQTIRENWHRKANREYKWMNQKNTTE